MLNSPWFTDVKRAALTALIVGVAALVVPVWRAGRQLMTTAPQNSPWWSPLLLVIGLIVSAILPLFYFALYRDPGTLRFPRSLRNLSLGAALVLAAVVAAGLPTWITSIRRYSAAVSALDWSGGGTIALRVLGDPVTLALLSGLLAQLSNLGYIVLLLAIFRQTSEESFLETDRPVSALLRKTTKAALIVWALAALFSLVRLVLTPYNYSQLQHMGFQVAERLPSLAGMMLKAASDLLESACLFIAPYVVYNSWLRPNERVEAVIPTETAAGETS
jgi:hypothetical protein